MEVFLKGFYSPLAKQKIGVQQINKTAWFESYHGFESWIRSFFLSAKKKKVVELGLNYLKNTLGFLSLSVCNYHHSHVM